MQDIHVLTINTYVYKCKRVMTYTYTPASVI